jgi:HTH-type transcriptional regulator / antitoxin HigA
MKKSVDWSKIAAAWSVLDDQLGPINLNFSSENADHIASIVDLLLKATSEANAPAALLRLLDALSDWLSEFERTHVDTSYASPSELLRHLMEANELRQKDIAPIFGGQSVVSDVLSGKRAINARQALQLGERFKLSPLAFISAPQEPASRPRAYFAQEASPEAKAYPAFVHPEERGVEALSMDSEILYMSAA